jgi:hypothetical protein
MAARAEQADRGVAKGGQVLRCVPLLDLTFVFAQGHIAHPMKALDAPVSAPSAAQKGGIGFRTREAADRILHVRGLFAFADGSAFQAADLGQAGPVEMLSQTGAGLQVPLDEPSVSFARRARLRKRLLPLPLGSGGKIPA